MKFLKGMPGVSQAQVNAALKQVNASAKQQGVTLQLRFQRSGNVTAGGKTVMSQDFSIGPP